MTRTNANGFYPKLREWIENSIVGEMDTIPSTRKGLLDDLRILIQDEFKKKNQVSLNFICTHNSRRSHISQIMAYTAYYYHDLSGKMEVHFFSGGTEATAFHPRGIEALQDYGFQIDSINHDTYHFGSKNPTYHVRISNEIEPILAFSKRYGDPPNPTKDYLAIMTCDHAAENCPIVFGADKKFGLTYRDPKESDGTPQESQIYKERIQEIGREMFYLFGNLHSQ